MVLIHESDYAAAEAVHFTCQAKHEMKPRKDRVDTTGFKNKALADAINIKPIHRQIYLIVLVIDNMKKLTKAQKLAVIAEEFAHVYLKHGLEGGLEKEEEAAMLIKNWGFSPAKTPE